MTQTPVELGGLAVEQNGINVIAESERKGKPSDLFWPWFAANISVLAISYGSFVVGFGVSFWQATLAGVIGVMLSFALCGVVALAGKRGSAPTMVLSRAAFGVTGNALPSAPVLDPARRLGDGAGLPVVARAPRRCSPSSAGAVAPSPRSWPSSSTAALVVGAGVLGFDVIMRLQTYITLATVVLTVGFVALTLDEIDWSTVSDAQSGSTQAFVGALALVTTGFGVGWANTAADYSRYLPRQASGTGVFGWTTLGGAVGAGRAPRLRHRARRVQRRPVGKIGADPIGALTTLLPTWYLVPFAIVAVLGLVGGAVLDIYSSGPRPADPRAQGAALRRGGGGRRDHGDRRDLPRVLRRRLHHAVPGLPDHRRCADRGLGRRLRRRPRCCARATTPTRAVRRRGRYGAIHWPGVLLVAARHLPGLGAGDQRAGRLAEVGGLPARAVRSGVKDGAWAYANLGVFVAFAVGFIGWLLLGRSTVARQESARADTRT